METKNFKATAAKAAKKIVNFVQTLVQGLFIVLGMFLLLIIYLLLFNPIVLWVWAMIAPKSAASHLNAIRGKKDGHPLDFPGEIFWEMNKKFRFLLPWRSKKEFLRVTCLSEATVAQEIKFFHSENALEVINSGWLSKEAKDELFLESGLCSWLLPKMGSLTTEQFSHLIRESEWKSIGEYFSKYTPSETMLQGLLNAAIEKGKADDSNPLKIFCSYAKKQGLSTNIINSLYQNKTISDVLEVIEDALACYGERQLVLAGREDMELWKKYCTLEDGKFFEENQILMNLAEYEFFHEQGMKLSNSAIVYFLSAEDLKMAKKVIEYEVIGQRVSENVGMLIVSNPKLLPFFVKKQAEAKAKN